MESSIENIFEGIAAILASEYSYPIYTSTNQQGTQYPCFFIFQMPSTMEQEIGNRYMRDIGIDIVFVQQRNITSAEREIRNVAEFLDYALDNIKVTDQGGNTAILSTYERQYQTEDFELHYKLKVKCRVSKPVNPVYMQTEVADVKVN